MQNHCCKILTILLSDEAKPIDYAPQWRTYDLSVPRIYLKKNSSTAGYTIDYCPFCGKEFPFSLADVWTDIVEKKFGEVDIFDDKSRQTLPKEFLSNAWWKGENYENSYNHLIMSGKERLLRCFKENNLSLNLDRGEFCCFGINSLINTDYMDCPLKYIPHRRHYLLTTPDYFIKRGQKASVYSIFFCPRCGTTLPGDLTSLWHTIIKKKFGLPIFAPKEFLTDEWWKDREL